ncbi:hypothetical protein AB0D13_27860, partial [Streptomyces sp. NPDC048430]|uniref:hypothetical protein n=1 Tax=Streptomyces sp. NPDC048430 TaxID=3155388 RepID=UPI00343432FD
MSLIYGSFLDGFIRYGEPHRDEDECRSLFRLPALFRSTPREFGERSKDAGGAVPIADNVPSRLDDDGV